MILSGGKIIDNKYQDEVIASLPERINSALMSTKLDISKLISACDRLSSRAVAGEFDDVAKPLLEFAGLSYENYIEYARMFSKEGLIKKTETEFFNMPECEVICDGHIRKRAPLGVLLHIAAGNVDVLPAYSVIEGLLAGNINILKLPTGDSGTSVKLLFELIREYPDLCDYIHVFDVPSAEAETLRRLADISDGVVVWGGDAAVSAVHKLIKPNTRLISWGHKLSFAYAAPDSPDAMLYESALDICKTNQLLCSSVQGIYLDTSDTSELEKFGARFFEILKEASKTLSHAPLGMRGKNTIKLYNDRLEGASGIFLGGGVSVNVRRDPSLELSYLFRNVWIKPLPKSDIIKVLKPNLSHLQTCALLVKSGPQREELCRIFVSAGITRITYGTTSKILSGEAHDGKFPLTEYSKIVDIYE